MNAEVKMARDRVSMAGKSASVTDRALQDLAALASSIFDESDKELERHRTVDGGLRAESGVKLDTSPCPLPGRLAERAENIGGGHRPAATWRLAERRVKVKKPKFKAPRARSGELRMIDFRRREAKRSGVSEFVVYERAVAGRYPGLKIRKPHPRYMFVRLPAVLVMVNDARPGEITLKEFVEREAALNGETVSAVYMRVARGRYPGLVIRKVNRRVVFVVTAAPGSLTGEKPS